MLTATRQQLRPAERRKIYLILLFTSLCLLFLAMWQGRPVLVKVSDPLGLINYLTPAYWAGLTLLFLASVAAFLDAEMKSDLVYMLLLLSLGLFLVGIVVFLYEGARNPDVYAPNSEAYRLVANGHFEINDLPAAAYYSWPSITIVNAATMLATGIKGDFIQNFVKYMPLLWILFFALTAYGVGRRLQLEPRYCFLIAFLALASWWELDAYHNHTWGPLLYLLLFMLLISQKKIPGETVAVILLFSALLITHATSSFMFFLAFMLLAIYRRDTRLVAIFLVLFGAWYTYQAWSVYDQGLHIALAGPFWQIKAVAQAERYALPSVGARVIARYSQLGYLAIYVGVIASCVLLFVARKVPKEHRNLFVACFLWDIGVVGMVATGISPELHRFFLFSLVPAGIMIVVSFTALIRWLQVPLIVGLMLATVALRLPAEYSLEAAWIQVPMSEVAGSRFFVENVKPGPVPNPFYFSVNGSVMKMVQGIDPRAISSSPFDIGTLPSWPKVDFAEIDKWVEYVMITRVGVDSEKFSLGGQFYTLWPQTEVGRKSYLIYDAGEFQLYYNPLAELTANSAYVHETVP